MKSFLPEIILVVTALVILSTEIFYSGERKRLGYPICFLGIAAAGLQIFANYSIPLQLDKSSFWSHDAFSLGYQWIILIGGASALVLFRTSQVERMDDSADFQIQALLLCALMMLLVQSVNLLISGVLIAGTSLLYSSILLHPADRGSSIRASWGVFQWSLFVSFWIFLSWLVLALSGSGFWFNNQNLNIQFLPKWEITAILFGYMGWMLFFPIQLFFKDAFSGMTSAQKLLFFGVMKVAIVAHSIRLISAMTGNLAQGTQFMQASLEIIGALSLLSSLFILYRLSSSNTLAKWCGFFCLSQMYILPLGFLGKSPKDPAMLWFFFLQEAVGFLGLYFVLNYFESRSRNLIWENAPKVFGRGPLLILMIFLGALGGVPPFPGFFARLSLISGVFEEKHNLLGLFSVSLCAITYYVLFKRVLPIIALREDRAAKLEDSGLWPFSGVLAFVLLFLSAFMEPLYHFAERSTQFIPW